LLCPTQRREENLFIPQFCWDKINIFLTKNAINPLTINKILRGRFCDNQIDQIKFCQKPDPSVSLPKLLKKRKT
jgi:hypothetical protein